MTAWDDLAASVTAWNKVATTSAWNKAERDAFTKLVAALKPAADIPPVTNTPPVTGKVPLGYFGDPGNADGGVGKLEAWMGRQVAVAGEFVPWASMGNDLGWIVDGYPSRVRLVHSLEIRPIRDAASRADFVARYTAWATSIKTKGRSGDVARIAWEANGWMPWGLPQAGGYLGLTDAEFVDCVTLAISTIRAVIPGMEVELNFACGGDLGMVTRRLLPKTIPGVNLGLDFYPAWIYGQATPAGRWNAYKTMAVGLDWQEATCKANGWKVVHSEWGVGCPTSDGEAGGNPANGSGFGDEPEWVDFFYDRAERLQTAGMWGYALPYVRTADDLHSRQIGVPGLVATALPKAQARWRARAGA